MCICIQFLLILSSPKNISYMIHIFGLMISCREFLCIFMGRVGEGRGVVVRDRGRGEGKRGERELGQGRIWRKKGRRRRRMESMSRSKRLQGTQIWSVRHVELCIYVSILDRQIDR